MGSSKFQLNKIEAKEVLSVAGWSFGSAVLIMLIDLLKIIDVPSQYGLLVSFANTLLYAALLFVKDNSSAS